MVGGVHVLIPVGLSKYFRLTWTNPDGTPGRTSAGRDLALAIEKAAEINAMIERAVGPAGSVPLDQVVEEYVSTVAGRNQRSDGGDWTETYRIQLRRHLRRAIHGFEEVPAWGMVCGTYLSSRKG